MTIADQIIAIQADLTALKTAVAALPTTSTGTNTVDLTPVTTAVAAVQATVTGIDANLKPTPAL